MAEPNPNQMENPTDKSSAANAPAPVPPAPETTPRDLPCASEDDHAKPPRSRESWAKPVP